MTPLEFQRKWTGHSLTERSSYQQHFLDLCDLVGQPKPAEVDQTGESFTFEKRVKVLGGGKGFADVWKRDFFGWEYKGPHADLDAALRQLMAYQRDLQNPPLLVVCDTDLIRVHTFFDRTANIEYTITLADITEPGKLHLLDCVFNHPDALRPDQSPAEVTEKVAAKFGRIAEDMRGRGVPAREAAHFLMKLIFCLFAEDLGLLPNGLMTKILDHTRDNPQALETTLQQLFRAMGTGGNLLWERIDHFNGGLFDDEVTVRLTPDEINALADVAEDDWSRIEPAVFGTLFERCLDPARRGQLGAHYTSRDDIALIVEPVVMQPLRREWEALQAACDELAVQAEAASGTARRNKHKALEQHVAQFMEHLAEVRVLDPACGSGNFLYVALNALKDLELEVLMASGRWNVQCPFPRVGPAQLYGLELDDYAVELAQLTVWIGYLQWTHFNGYRGSERPILQKLDNIRLQDAILGPDDEHGNPTEPSWPEAEFIVGNPPFLGGKRLRTELGDEYVDRLFRLYDGRVPHEADLCCYWFERSRAQIADGPERRAGLLATNSIRKGPQMRPVLERLLETGGIFMAWSDRPWVLAGAAVRIAAVGFDDGTQTEKVLDGAPEASINADLTGGLDLTRARRLAGNEGIAFMGDTKGGPFEIPANLAGEMLAASNPLGRNNADVLRPWYNGMDVMRRPRGMWIIDFGCEMTEREAALYERPFEYVMEHVYPQRAQSRTTRSETWLHERPRPDMREAVAGLDRVIATCRVARHRLFALVDQTVLCDSRLFVFARGDDYAFGLLHSLPHELWTIRMCSWHGKGNDPVYTPTTCFETFPFPLPTDSQREAISAAAKALHETRQSALDNDPELTLTKLYNRRPTWLDHLHRDLDVAVLDAYGWGDLGATLPPHGEESEAAKQWTETLLERLLALNLERAAEESQGTIRRP